ncbi:MAG: phytanoyl-CoA dioxygenase family protein [Dyella sp.]|nr:phytanoyl-CoA dioxygenase family protein [Dyella sp.]
MREHRFSEAIELLVDSLRNRQDMLSERLLAESRYLAYVFEPPQSQMTDPWSGPVPDPFMDVGGIPEIAAHELDTPKLVAGIRRHGALLVRGLLATDKAEWLAKGIRQAVDDCMDWHKRGGGESVSPWYARLPLREDCELAADTRYWIEGAGGVWTADSPRLLNEIIRLFEHSGVIDVIGGYFGERPMLTVGKSTLRCVPATQLEADWHQDGAFMGEDIRSVNLWVSLSHCGEDAAGLELLPRRLSRVLPTGTHGANFGWSVGPGMVQEAAEGMATVSPRFAPGDALLFDHLFLHRTSVPAGISKDRYAIESWFFAPSAYPAQQVPLRL